MQGIQTRLFFSPQTKAIEIESKIVSISSSYALVFWLTGQLVVANVAQIMFFLCNTHCTKYSDIIHSPKVTTTYSRFSRKADPMTWVLLNSIIYASVPFSAWYPFRHFTWPLAELSMSFVKTRPPLTSQAIIVRTRLSNLTLFMKIPRKIFSGTFKQSGKTCNAGN